MPWLKLLNLFKSVEKAIIESMRWYQKLPVTCPQCHANDPRAILTRVARTLPDVIALPVLRSNDFISIVEPFLPVRLFFPDDDCEYQLTAVIFMLCLSHYMYDNQRVEPFANSTTTQIKTHTVIALYSRRCTPVLSWYDEDLHSCER
jgi:hypothetical protein